jgi:crotonobetainyl-CoA:carnitine CoA-transferase CaiB-like acyl-CoA transferase
MATSQSTGSLNGIRVLDLTTVIMGPFATHILADLGADVIKIEGPEGDSVRRYRPSRHDGMSGPILNLHRNKRSIHLDLKHPTGRKALDRLIEGADVLVHNLRPGAASRLGLDWDSVRAVNPGIVLCAARGFSEKGPYGHKAAYDDLIQAGSGIAALWGQVQGTPAYVPTVLCDKLAGQAAAYAILAALLHRARGGEGQAIEVPMFEVAIEFMLMEHFGGSAFEPPLGPPGFVRKPYRTSDGWACILPYSDRNWADFFNFGGNPEMADDPRFRTIEDRVENIDTLYQYVATVAPRLTTDAWVEFCDRVSIPCMPVMALEDLPDDPHVQAVGLFETKEHPTEGAYRSLRSPIRFEATPYELRRHAPRPGEHTREVLAEAGISAQDILEISGDATG